MGSRLFQHCPQLFHQGRREIRVFYQPLNHGKIFPDFLEILVFLVMEVLEPAVLQELLHHIRPQVIGLGGVDGNLGRRGRDFFLFQENLGAQQHSSGLSADQSRAFSGSDDPVQEVAEVPDVQVVFGNADEFQLIGNEALDQGHPRGDGLPNSQGRLALGQIAEVSHLLGQKAEGNGGQIGDFLEGAGFDPFAHQVDDVVDFLMGIGSSGQVQEYSLDDPFFLLVPAVGGLRVVIQGFRVHLVFAAYQSPGLRMNLVQGCDSPAVEIDQESAENSFLEIGPVQQDLDQVTPIFMIQTLGNFHRDFHS